MRQTIREFKRHYTITKSAYRAAGGDETITFTVSKEEEGTSFVESPYDKHAVTLYATLVYLFVNKNSNLYYGYILDRLHDTFPKIVTDDRKAGIQNGIAKIEKGEFEFRKNGRKFTAREVFDIAAKAGLLDRSEDAVEFMHQLKEVGIAYRIFWIQFRHFAFQAFQIVEELQKVMIEAEQLEEYKEFFQKEESPIKKCIYCLSTTNSFTSEEHVIPESLIGDVMYVPRGVVCDECNHGICSILDNHFMEYPAIGFLKVSNTVVTKKGKFPKFESENIKIERDALFNFDVRMKHEGEVPIEELLEDGRKSVKVNFTDKKPHNPKMLARALFKFGLGIIALTRGHSVALSSQFDPARRFILNGGSFPNSFLIRVRNLTKPSFEFFYEPQICETLFVLSFYGFAFMFNISEEPQITVEGLNLSTGIFEEHSLV